MKVVVSGYIGKKITGIGRNLIELLDNASSDLEFVVYTNYDMVDDFKFKNPNVTVKAYNISKMSSAKNLLWTTFKFPKFVRKEKADVELIPNFTLLLKKAAPTVVILHDLIEFNIKDKFSKKKMFYRTKIADPITAKKADHLITVSNNSKNDIMKFLKIKDEKITVVYDGVDTSKFKNNKKSRIELPEKYLLYVGTVDHPGKNAMNLIKSYELLRNRNVYDGKLIIAGMPGKGYEIVEEYANNSTFKKDIIFYGYVNDDILPTLYSNTDLFCFLSLYEGFGIPPLEALACGAKVLVSNRSSLPEVVGDCGMLVDPDNIEKIADAIMHAINNEKVPWIDIEKHIKKFNWNDLGVEFSNVLQKTLKSNKKK